MNVLFSLLLILQGGAVQEQREFEMPYGDSTITMKRYVMCIYTAGDNRSQNEEQAMEIQKAHLAHQDVLADKGLLLVAGPFGGDGDKRGILIFDVGTVAEAEPLVKDDPAVKAGRLNYELLEWWTMKGSVIK